MNERSRELQARLRARFDQKMGVGQVCANPHVVAIEELAEVPEGAEGLVGRVIAELAARGLRVADIRRLNENTMLDEVAKVGAEYLDAGSVATVYQSEGKLVVVKPAEPGMDINRVVAELGDDYDVIIAERVAFMTVPKILVTKKPQEGFNLGLPNLEAYVSDNDLNNFLPCFAPSDVAGLADFIEARYAKRRIPEKTAGAVSMTAAVARPEAFVAAGGAVRQPEGSAASRFAEEPRRLVATLSLHADRTEPQTIIS